MDPPELRRAFRDREFVSGSLIQIPEPALVEMLGEFVDFVIVDMEHSRADIETVEELVRAADAVDLVPLVRAPGPIRNHPDFVRRALDLGAAGVVLPRIEDGDEAAYAADVSKFHPEGDRGICTLTRNFSYTFRNDPEDVERLNEGTSMVGLIEKRQAVENIEDIFSAGVLDAVILGPSDYAQSIGRPGELRHAEVVEAFDRVIGAANDHGVAVGAYAMAGSDVEEWREKGADFVFYSDVRMVAEGMKQTIQMD